MQLKFTNHFISRLEDIFSQSDYILRYEKGNFKSGYCLLKDQKIVIVNKYYSLEGKINCLVDILRSVALDLSKMDDKNKALYHELTQTEIEL